ncbi:hypothetical protein M3Y94_01205000 [Aphelenchoides besseyi]|nr:hypothetical protein M3Y94_01205000 [Aphelenchoides besseyi]KAI6228474.1 Glutamyl-tRNA(Gln) amidotransferase and Asn Gln amidotransferase domain containing protein [Aphelenchoides besseyi]
MILRRWKPIRKVVVRNVNVDSKRNMKPVIGLEIHAQLEAKSKMFSDAPISAHAPSNTNVSLFDLSTPGTLPTLNRKCVELALRTAVLLNCKISSECRFDRKHYFYPDMPQGYQITQNELPIARNGYLDYLLRPTDINRSYQPVDKKRLRIKQIQMEMDSGKLVHGVERELIDLNRVGIGLVEIVTEPDLSSALEAACFAEHLRLMLIHNSICQGEMHHGQLRIDANVSITVDGKPGVRTEIKNINSFRDLQSGLDFEIRRHVELINRNEEVRSETRGVAEGQTFLLRTKGNDLAYRFTPEPNLPRLRIKSEWLQKAEESVRWDASHLKYVFDHDFPIDFAFQMVYDLKMQKFVHQCMKMLTIESKLAVPLLRSLRLIFQSANSQFPPKSKFVIRACCRLIDIEVEGQITHLIFLDLIRLYASSQPPSVDVEEKINELNLWTIRDPPTIQRYVDEAVDTAPSNLIQQAIKKPNSKHFNKIRNLVVNASNKRIDIADVERFVTQKLKNYESNRSE